MPGARPSGKAPRKLLAFLEAAYLRFNRSEYIHPDPLELVLRYRNADDREVAGLVASSLALGTVKGILAGAGGALARLGPSPSRSIETLGPRGLREAFSGFRYRFFPGEEMASFLAAVAALRGVHGSLGSRIARLAKSSRADTALPALDALAAELSAAAPRPYRSSLFPAPSGGSACKRPLLWLRWMARRDEVDPGPWKRGLEPYLVSPLDTHMGRVGRKLGLLGRNGADLKAALEITASFKALNPEDPVKYDFALTRPGINPCLETGADLACLRAPRYA